MKCDSCGYENPSDVQYCLKCGKELSKTPETNNNVTEANNNVVTPNNNVTETNNNESMVFSTEQPTQSETDLEKTMVIPNISALTKEEPVVSSNIDNSNTNINGNDTLTPNNVFPNVESSNTGVTETTINETQTQEQSEIPDLMNAFEPMDAQPKNPVSSEAPTTVASAAVNPMEDIISQSATPVEPQTPPVEPSPSPATTTPTPVIGVEKNKVVSNEPRVLSESEHKQLMKDFTGNNYPKILVKTINWSAVFFGSLYFFYRRMIALGLLLMAIESVVYNVINKTLVTMNLSILGKLFINIGIYILVGLIIGLCFKNIFVNHAKRKIKKVLAYNKNESFENIRVQVARIGGTNIAAPFAYIGVSTLLLPLILIFTIGSGVASMIDSIQSQLDISQSNTASDISDCDGTIITTVVDNEEVTECIPWNE